MPHFIIETVNAVGTAEDRQDVMRIVADFGASQDSIDPSDIKVRLYPCNDALALDGRTSFIHITARLLAGRTSAQKDALAIGLRDALDVRFPDVQSISIDVCDMDPDCYRKRLL